MIEKQRKISYNNRGSAIITAMVVTTVLMVLCLSLLSVAYSLFLSQKGNTSDMPERELLYSAVEAFEGELINAKSISGEATGGSGETTLSEFGNSIIKSIIETLGNIEKTGTGYSLKNGAASDWLCYELVGGTSSNSGNPSNLEKCSRFFNITSIGSVKIVAQMYWTIPENWDGTMEKAAGTTLHAIYRLYDAKTMELEVKTEREYELAGWMTGQGQGTEIPISVTGKYTISFANVSGSKAKVCLPKTLYFQSLDEVYLPVLSEYSGYNFYKKSTRSDANLIDTVDKLKDLLNEENNAILFIDWGTEGAPYAVRFILNGKCIATEKWRKNKPGEQGWNRSSIEELILNNKSYYGVEASDGIGDWIYNDWENNQVKNTDTKYWDNNGNPTQFDGDVNVFIVLKSNYFEGKYNEGEYNPTYNIDFSSIPVFSGESLDISVDKGVFHWERVFDKVNT